MMVRLKKASEITYQEWLDYVEGIDITAHNIESDMFGKIVESVTVLNIPPNFVAEEIQEDPWPGRVGENRYYRFNSTRDNMGLCGQLSEYNPELASRRYRMQDCGGYQFCTPTCYPIESKLTLEPEDGKHITYSWAGVPRNSIMQIGRDVGYYAQRIHETLYATPKKNTNDDVCYGTDYSADYNDCRLIAYPEVD